MNSYSVAAHFVSSKLLDDAIGRKMQDVSQAVAKCIVMITIQKWQTIIVELPEFVLSVSQNWENILGALWCLDW